MISERDMRGLFIFLIAVGAVGGWCIIELIRWLWRHISFSWI